MTTADSGVIDLFAIHKEEEVRKAAAALPSSPPPAVSMDLAISDDEIDGYAAAQQRSRKRTKIVGGIVGSLAVVGVIAGAIVFGGTKEAPKPTAAAEPPPPAMTAPPPVAQPAPAPAPSPPATTKSKDDKADYTPATAAAAYAVSQGKGKKVVVGKPAPKMGSGIKLQKVQSSGTGL